MLCLMVKNQNFIFLNNCPSIVNLIYEYFGKNKLGIVTFVKIVLKTNKLLARFLVGIIIKLRRNVK